MTGRKGWLSRLQKCLLRESLDLWREFSIPSVEIACGACRKRGGLDHEG
jgi:hypothetical protein